MSELELKWREQVEQLGTSGAIPFIVLVCSMVSLSHKSAFVALLKSVPDKLRLTPP